MFFSSLYLVCIALRDFGDRRSISTVLLLLLYYHLASQGKQDEEALMGNRFVGIHFIYTDLYDLPTFPRINVFDKSLTM